MLNRVPIEKVLVLTVPFLAFAYLIYYGFYSLEHARAKNSEESLSSIFTSSSSSMMSLPQVTLNSRNGRCSYDLYRKYKSPRQKSEGSWKWCEKKRKVHSVRPGYSFGTLSNVDRSMWERSDCNSLLLSGPQFSCFDKYSWKFLKSWLNQNVSLMYGGSVSDMYKSLYGNYLYSMKHVILDPTKTEIVSSTNSRVCHEGFLTTFATKLDVNIDSLLDPYVDGTFCLFNGYKNINMNELKGSHSDSDENNFNNNNDNNNVDNVLKDIYSQCDIIETKPVFLVSHDDIYNLAHFMNDAMSLWSMLMLSGKNGSESILLNIDGLNYLGPSGGTPHRMMNVKDPDTLNMPFVDLYKTWYSEIKNLDSYGNKKICFKELYVIPNPVAPWVWDGWRHQSECSLLLPSSLYQSYNFFIRDKWETNSRAISGKSQTSAIYKSLSDTLHLVISIRKSSSEKEIDANVNSLVRVIANINSLVESIHSNIPNLKITLQDFSDIDYVQQVNLIKSGILLPSFFNSVSILSMSCYFDCLIVTEHTI